jgi:DNA mismatch repair protein MutS
MALAQAIIEYIHKRIGAKTLFSTHYHELTVLEEELPRLKNIHVSAIEHNGKVVFLHKIKEGPADKSYGIHVAQLAELPAELIDRANEILTALEQSDAQPITPKPVVVKEVQPQEQPAQLSFFDEPKEAKKQELTSKEKRVLEKMRELDILDLTPLQAINILYELQKKLK